MTFKEIIKGININCSIIKDDSDNHITDIVLNSKTANENNIFVAIKGFNTDGHKYIFDAYKNGCRNFVVQEIESINFDNLEKSTVIKVADSRIALALISNYIFDYPFSKLKMIGITGTKGKTTVSTLLHYLITGSYKSSLFTTIKNIINNVSTDSVRTTMESNELERLLKKSLDSGESIAVVEVSSHAVTLKRIYDINWDAGIFTSFSRDHLDLYGTMENYFEAKLDFFRQLNKSDKKNKFAVINIDDPKGRDVVKVINKSVKIITIGQDDASTCKIVDCKLNDYGLLLSLKIKNKIIDFQSNLKGDFNINNIALSIITALECGVTLDVIKNRLFVFPGVPGRFEIIVDKPFKVIVDYAHTPQSLENILNEGRKLTTKKVIIVFGCTGERDKDKRPIMGEIAGKLSDYTIITNDDTYNEDPLTIADAVESGLITSGKNNNNDYSVILDRKSAIEFALKFAAYDDVIILAGMGHEKYQILNNGLVEHNDKMSVLDLIKKMTNDLL